jgi:hypothetical protein
MNQDKIPTAGQPLSEPMMKDLPGLAPSATLIDLPRHILETPQRPRPLLRLMVSQRKLLIANLQRDRVDLRLYDLAQVQACADRHGTVD